MLTLLLALGMAGCGGDSEEEPDRPAQAAAETTDRIAGAGTEQPGSPAGAADPSAPAASDTSAAAPPADSGQKPAADEQAVEEVVEGVYSDLGAGDAAGVCSALSNAVRERAAQDVIQGTTTPPGKRTCVASLQKFMDVASRSGGLKTSLGAEVMEVTIDGPQAIAKVTLGGRVGKVRLVLEDGAWRFGSAPTGGP